VDGIVGPQTREKLFGSSHNETDLYWLSRIIHAEAKGESYKGKVAVGNTVLNRVKSKDFPNTVKGVIFDSKYGVQYTPVANNTIYNTPDQSSINAAKDALSGVNYVGNSMYFYNPRTATSSWISKNRPYYATIGNHNFHL
jgi:N-acetylmuramoyl-L-alanine amidase